MSTTPVPTGGVNVPSVLTPGNSQLGMIQGGPQIVDPATGVPYAPLVVGGSAQPPCIPTTSVTASATAGAGASNSAALPAVGGKTNYITGFVITSSAPAATQSGLVTITGTISGTLNFYFVESNTFGGEMIVNFSEPIPASAVNTAITVNVPTIGSGGSTAIALTGFVQ